jgi:hypothetical protein
LGFVAGMEEFFVKSGKDVHVSSLKKLKMNFILLFILEVFS